MEAECILDENFISGAAVWQAAKVGRIALGFFAEIWLNMEQLPSRAETFEASINLKYMLSSEAHCIV